MIIRPVFVIPNLLGGGAERVLLTLLRHMGSEFQPTILLLRNEIAYPDEIPQNVRLIAISQKGERIRNNLTGLKQIIKGLSDDSDIIIGSLELDATYWAYGIGKRIQKPVIGWNHTPMPAYLRGYSRIHKSLTRYVYPRLDHIVYSSEYIQSEMSVLLEALPRSESVIHNPLDRDWIIKKSQEPLPGWASSMLQKPFIIALGRLVQDKGFDILLRGFALAINRGLNFDLLILGEGEQRHSLQELAQSLGIANRLFLPGFVPNPYPWIYRAAALTSPSKYEGVGMTLLEAMALKVPVIANASAGGPGIILGNGKFGYLVKVNEPESWADALLLINGQSSSILQAGFLKTESYTPPYIINQWENVFRNSISHHQVKRQ